MNDDASLLRSYADEKSDAAFAELVRRHLDLVYGAALRRTGGDAHSASDIAQQVFTNLARNARKLSRHTVVSAWLYTATRNAALNLMISDQRRKAREAAALALHATEASGPDWERVRPLIDDAIDELPEEDRNAVVLRFLEQRAFAEIGATLRLSEDTARKRVDRALEKLRAALARRGVESTSAALATVFANEVAATAPAGLAGAITGNALAGAIGSGLAIAGVGIFMSMKTTAIISAVAITALVATFLQWNRAFRAESELAALTVDRDGLRGQLRTEQQRTARAAQDVVALQNEVEVLKAKQVVATTIQRTAPMAAPAPKSSGVTVTPAKAQNSYRDKQILNHLRVISAARDDFQRRNGRPPTSLEEIVGEGKFIHELSAVDGENYSSVSLITGQALTIVASDGTSITYDPVAAGPSRIEPSEAELHARELADKIQPAHKIALKRLSHRQPG